jgi:hypothetical protein
VSSTTRQGRAEKNLRAIMFHFKRRTKFFNQNIFFHQSYLEVIEGKILETLPNTFFIFGGTFLVGSETDLILKIY